MHLDVEWGIFPSGIGIRWGGTPEFGYHLDFLLGVVRISIWTEGTYGK